MFDKKLLLRHIENQYKTIEDQLEQLTEQREDVLVGIDREQKAAEREAKRKEEVEARNKEIRSSLQPDPGGNSNTSSDLAALAKRLEDQDAQFGPDRGPARATREQDAVRKTIGDVDPRESGHKIGIRQRGPEAGTRIASKISAQSSSSPDPLSSVESGVNRWQKNPVPSFEPLPNETSRLDGFPGVESGIGTKPMISPDASAASENPRWLQGSDHAGTPGGKSGVDARFNFDRFTEPDIVPGKHETNRQVWNEPIPDSTFKGRDWENEDKPPSITKTPLKPKQPKFIKPSRNMDPGFNKTLPPRMIPHPFKPGKMIPAPGPVKMPSYEVPDGPRLGYKDKIKYQ